MPLDGSLLAWAARRREERLGRKRAVAAEIAGLVVELKRQRKGIRQGELRLHALKIELADLIDGDELIVQGDTAMEVTQAGVRVRSCTQLGLF